MSYAIQGLEGAQRIQNRQAVGFTLNQLIQSVNEESFGLEDPVWKESTLSHTTCLFCLYISVLLLYLNITYPQENSTQRDQTLPVWVIFTSHPIIFSMLSMCYTPTYREMGLWRVFDCALYTGTFASDATAVKGAAPFISSPTRVFQQLCAKSQELCWKML